MHPCGDGPQPLRPMPDGVEPRHHRQQDLRGADVRRRLLPPDVLLACLQGEPHRRPSRRIHRYAHDAARQRPPEPLARSEERRVRATETHRHPEALRRSDHHVGALAARARQHHQGERVGADDRQRSRLMRGLDFGRQITDLARRSRILQHHASRRSRLLQSRPERPEIARLVVGQSRPQRRRPCRHHRARLRMQVARQDHRACTLLGHRLRHRDGFGHCGRLVEQRRVGDRQPGQVRHHRLEIQQRLEPPLCDLRLVGRVGRVPGRALQHVARDHRRHMRAMIAAADQRPDRHVLARQRPQLRQGVDLAQRPRQPFAEPVRDRRRDRPLDQRVEGGRPYRLEHGGDLRRVRSDMTIGERGAFLPRKFQGRHRPNRAIRHHNVSRKA